MSVLEWLLRRFAPDRHSGGEAITFDDDGANGERTDAVIHRSTQVETAMQVQSGVLRRQSERLRQALERGDDEEIATVSKAMMRTPSEEKMWFERALTPRRDVPGGQR